LLILECVVTEGVLFFNCCF